MPFVQLIKEAEYQDHKLKVTKKLTELLQGDALI